MYTEAVESLQTTLLLFNKTTILQFDKLVIGSRLQSTGGDHIIWRLPKHSTLITALTYC